MEFDITSPVPNNISKLLIRMLNFNVPRMSLLLYLITFMKKKFKNNFVERNTEKDSMTFAFELKI